MKSLVDNLLFYPMVQSSFLVLRSSYFLIDSCWVQSLIWHVPYPPTPSFPLCIQVYRTCRKVRQSVLEFSEWTHRVASTDQGQGSKPLRPIATSVRWVPREDRNAHVLVCFLCARRCSENLSRTLAARQPRGWTLWLRGGAAWSGTELYPHRHRAVRWASVSPIPQTAPWPLPGLTRGLPTFVLGSLKYSRQSGSTFDPLSAQPPPSRRGCHCGDFGACLQYGLVVYRQTFHL